MVTALCFANNKLFSGHSNGEIWAWNIDRDSQNSQTRFEKVNLRKSSGLPVTTLEYQNATIWTCSEKKLQGWDVDTCKQVADEDVEADLLKMKIRKDQLFGCSEKDLLIYEKKSDMPGWLFQKKIALKEGELSDFDVSEDGRKALVIKNGKYCCGYDLEHSKLISEFTRKDKDVDSIFGVFIRDPYDLFLGYHNAFKLTKAKLANGKGKLLEIHRRRCGPLAVSNNIVAGIVEGHDLELWDTNTEKSVFYMQCERDLNGEKTHNRSTLDFTAKEIHSNDHESLLKIRFKKIKNPPNPAKSVAISPDTKKAALGTEDDDIFLADRETCCCHILNPRRDTELFQPECSEILMTAAGRAIGDDAAGIYILTEDCRFSIIDLSTGQQETYPSKIDLPPYKPEYFHLAGRLFRFGDNFLLSEENKIYSFNPESGKVNWEKLLGYTGRHYKLNERSLICVAAENPGDIRRKLGIINAQTGEFKTLEFKYYPPAKKVKDGKWRNFHFGPLFRKTLPINGMTWLTPLGDKFILTIDWNDHIIPHIWRSYIIDPVTMKIDEYPLALNDDLRHARLDYSGQYLTFGKLDIAVYKIEKDHFTEVLIVKWQDQQAYFGGLNNCRAEPELGLMVGSCTNPIILCDMAGNFKKIFMGHGARVAEIKIGMNKEFIISWDDQFIFRKWKL